MNLSNKFSLFLLFSLLMISFYSNTSLSATMNNNVRILIFGDSLSAGYGVKKDQEWPHLLEQSLKLQTVNIKVINDSISGETTAGGLQRISNSIMTHKPEIIVIALGANDGLRGYSLKTMRKNLTKMIHKAKSAGIQVLLVGMHIPPNLGKRYTQQFHQTFHDVAEESKVALLPFLLEGVALEPELMQKDRLHPNENAQPIIMQTVKQSLIKLLPK